MSNDDIITWEEFDKSETVDESIISQLLNKNPIDSRPAFPPYRDLNSKIYISKKSSISVIDSNISIDALILQIPKKHLIAKPTDYRCKIIQKCGEYIYTELSLDPILNLAECLVTSAYNISNIKKIIHTALPKYSLNYTNASISALHLSFRTSLDLCIENNWEILLIGRDIFQPVANFPWNESVEVIIRTLRKCLDVIGIYISKIIIAVEDEEIYNMIVLFLKIYFPRNKAEQSEYSKYIGNWEWTKYGDIILPQRQLHIDKNIKLNPNYEKTTTNSLIYNNDLYSFTFDNNKENSNSSSQNTDQTRISEVFNEKVDFAKKFYYDNIQHYSEEIENMFENINFIQYKGTDIEKRQLFFIYLKCVNFTLIEEYKIENDFWLYCYNFVKWNFQKDKKFSLLFFFGDWDKCNYPPFSFVESIRKMVLSFSTLNYVNLSDIDICWVDPGVMFLMYYQVLKFYLQGELADRVTIYDNYAMLNNNYYLGLDKDIEDRIGNQVWRCEKEHWYEEIFKLKKNRRSNMFKENYMFSNINNNGK